MTEAEIEDLKFKQDAEDFECALRNGLNVAIVPNFINTTSSMFDAIDALMNQARLKMKDGKSPWVETNAIDELASRLHIEVQDLSWCLFESQREKDSITNQKR